MQNKSNAWLWIPTLYFASGLPYHAITSISDIMYKDMGIDNAHITLYTSLLLIPWTIKPLWSPIVEMISTRRKWTLVSQLLLAISFAAIALVIPSTHFLTLTLVAFFAGAFISSTHDIALDGFYMLGLPQEKQSFFSGIRNTFYRIATVFSSGALVMLAGSIANSSEAPTTYKATRATTPIEEIAVVVDKTKIIEKSDSNTTAEEVSIFTYEATSFTERFSVARSNMGKGGVFEWNDKLYNTYYQEEWGKLTENERKEFTKSVVEYHNNPQKQITTDYSATEPAKNIATSQAIESEKISDNPILTTEPEPQPQQFCSQHIKDNSSTAWSITFAVTGAIMLALYLYNRRVMPIPEKDFSRKVGVKGAFANYGDIIKTYFKKPGILQAILFLLLFRFPEAQLGKMSKLFLMDPNDAGGLALSNSDIGFVYGVIGVVGLIIGGIIGGICISRKGLKYWLWPMVIAISLPDAVYIYMSMELPGNLNIVGSCIFIEQLGYGFGFTAYTLYMIYFAQGKYPTAHFAISTAFMSLGMMLPGMFAGQLQECWGYKNFFIWVTACTAITFAVSALIKIDPGFGKRQK